VIRAGLTTEIQWGSGKWIFVDLGFSRSNSSCGFLEGEGDPAEVKFSYLIKRVSEVVNQESSLINLLIEAPLSVTFTPDGNPTGRKFERRGRETRYWYVGLGCSVLVAATYLLRAIAQINSSKEIRLFEGLASFRPKGVISSHARDVLQFREIVKNLQIYKDLIIDPEYFKMESNDILCSAFRVANMDFGVPPVIIVNE
jgi:hypothetical protein